MTSSRGALAYALGLVERDIPCFPVRLLFKPGARRPSKVPTCPNGFKDATRDKDELQRLWRKHPGPVIGVPTGTLNTSRA